MQTSWDIPFTEILSSNFKGSTLLVVSNCRRWKIKKIISKWWQIILIKLNDNALTVSNLQYLVNFSCWTCLLRLYKNHRNVKGYRWRNILNNLNIQKLANYTIVGRTTYDFNSSLSIWDFKFKDNNQHPNPIEAKLTGPETHWSPMDAKRLSL